MRRRLLSMLLLSAAGVLSPAATALALPAPGPAFGARLYDVPVIDAHNPRAQRYIVDFLHPGMVIHRRILILNQEPQRSRFSVYPDAAQIAHGAFVGDAGQTRSELTGWITIQHPVVRLAPRASTLDMVTIRVPSQATGGEHYGVIWVQQTASARSATGTAILEVARVGIRIYLAVGHGLPPTKFVITSLAGHRSRHGQPYLVAKIHNTGQRAVDINGELRLTDGPGGITAGPFQEQQVVTLAPGQYGNVIFVAGKLLPDGPWHATVTLVSGLNTSAAQSTIQFGGHDLSSWTRLSWLIWAVGIVIALVAIALVLRGRRARRPAHSRGAITGRRSAA
jgi:hypothetical protein